MTNKELSTKIRKTLKESGYTSKDIKVSVRSSLYDTVAKITIHNPHINKNEIEKLLLTAYEEIDRDIVTGEILQGGNTMLFIDYEYGIFEEVALEWMATAKGLMQNLICVNSSTNSQNSKRSQYDRARKKTEKICLKRSHRKDGFFTFFIIP